MLRVESKNDSITTGRHTPIFYCSDMVETGPNWYCPLGTVVEAAPERNERLGAKRSERAGDITIPNLAAKLIRMAYSADRPDLSTALTSFIDFRAYSAEPSSIYEIIVDFRTSVDREVEKGLKAAFNEFAEFSSDEYDECLRQRCTGQLHVIGDVHQMLEEQRNVSVRYLIENVRSEYVYGKSALGTGTTDPVKEEQFKDFKASFMGTVDSCARSIDMAAQANPSSWFDSQMTLFLRAVAGAIPLSVKPCDVSKLVTPAIVTFRRLLSCDDCDGVDFGETTERHTQILWVALCAVANGLMEDEHRLEVIDSSRSYFVGSGAQPDISFIIPGAPVRAHQCVRSVMELKKGSGGQQALRQLVQRMVEISNHRIEPLDYLIGGAADDKSLIVARCDMLDPAQFRKQDPIPAIKCAVRPFPLASVSLTQKGSFNLVLSHICALMRTVREPPAKAVADDMRGSGMAKLDGSECVAIIYRAPGKPTVSAVARLPRGQDGFHCAASAREIVIEKEFGEGSVGEYHREVANIRGLLNSDLAALKGVEFVDNNEKRAITFKTVGHRVRIHTAKEFGEALQQLEAEIVKMHALERSHGDISVRNMIMCTDNEAQEDRALGKIKPINVTRGSTLPGMVGEVERFHSAALKAVNVGGKAAVSYHLIDFGSVEVIGKVNYAFTEQTSYPLEKSGTDDALARDLFALRTSLLLLASEGHVFLNGFPKVERAAPVGEVFNPNAFYDERLSFFNSVAADDAAPKCCQTAAAECVAIWKFRTDGGDRPDAVLRVGELVRRAKASSPKPN